VSHTLDRQAGDFANAGFIVDDQYAHGGGKQSIRGQPRYFARLDPSAAALIPAKKAKAGPRERPRQVQLQLTIPEVAPPGSGKLFQHRKEQLSACLRVTRTMPQMNSEHHHSHRRAACHSNPRQQTSDLATGSGENKKSRNSREKDQRDHPV
jgi:hypothetical protein